MLKKIILNNDIEALEKEFDNGLDAKSIDSKGRTLLHELCSLDFLKIKLIECCLKRGLDLNVQDNVKLINKSVFF